MTQTPTTPTTTQERAAVPPIPLPEPSRGALPWHALLRETAVAWLWSRLALAALTYTGVLLLRPSYLPPWPRVTPPLRVGWGDLLTRWTLFDGRFFREIAVGNYPAPADAAFFPLYPLLVRVVHLTPGGSVLSWTLAGLVVSQIATFAALLFLTALAHQTYGVLQAGRLAQRVLLAYPLAFFLTATYTDGLFLVLAAASILAARRRQWWLAAGVAVLAGLTRPTAVILVAPLVWEWGCAQNWSEALGAARRQQVRQLMRQLVPGIALVGAVPVALGIFALYCWRHYGDPLAFVHAQALFGIGFRWPWQTVLLEVRQIQASDLGTWSGAHLLLDAIPVLVLLAVTVLGGRRRPFADTLYLGGLVLLCLTSPIVVARDPDALAGAGRFILAAVPLWLAAGRTLARHPWLDTPLVLGAALLQGALVAFALTGGWLI